MEPKIDLKTLLGFTPVHLVFDLAISWSQDGPKTVPRGLLGGSWAVLGPSWGGLGPVLGPLGAYLGDLRAHFGSFGGGLRGRFGTSYVESFLCFD